MLVVTKLAQVIFISKNLDHFPIEVLGLAKELDKLKINVSISNATQNMMRIELFLTHIFHAVVFVPLPDVIPVFHMVPNQFNLSTELTITIKELLDFIPNPGSNIVWNLLIRSTIILHQFYCVLSFISSHVMLQDVKRHGQCLIVLI